MSRSHKKTIAWGWSTTSRSNGNGRYGYLKKQVNKLRKENKPIPKSHQRAELQTEQDYVDMANSFFSYEENSYKRIYGGKLKKFLNGKELTPELANEFGKIMYRKDRSR